MKSAEGDASSGGTSSDALGLKMPQSKPRSEKRAEHSSYSCTFPDCSKTFLSYLSLKAHYLAHSGVRPYTCQWSGCDRTFGSFSRMTAHCRTHTGERPYRCTVADCQKAFRSSSDLQRHARIHTGDKPYACTFHGCFKRFSTLDIRKVHMRTHTGEKPFVCNVGTCGKTFSSRNNLSNHLRTHTGEKPYKCKHPGCNKSFAEYSTLHKHQAVHLQPSIACAACPRKFRSWATFEAHRRREHGEAPDAPADPPTEEPTEPAAAGAESPQRIQLLLTGLDGRALEIDGETPQVLVLPADGDPGQEPDGGYGLQLLGCTGALVVHGHDSPELEVPSEVIALGPEPGEVGLSVVVGERAAT